MRLSFGNNSEKIPKKIEMMETSEIEFERYFRNLSLCEKIRN